MMTGLPLVLIYGLIGLISSFSISIAAYKARVIRRDALLASTAIGTLVSLLGPISVMLFLLFLAYAVAVTKLGRGIKARLGVDKDIGGRNFKQVVSVGMVPSLLAAASSLTYIMGMVASSKILLLAYVTSLASTSADTWASEVGVLSRSKPRLLTMPRANVAPGTSGAVTLMGELSSVAGSSAVVFTYLMATKIFDKAPPLIAFNWDLAKPTTILVVSMIILGYVGEVLDSVLGAIAQPKYFCDRCHVITEHEVHICGNPTRIIYKPPISLRNEEVNLVSTVVVALLAILIYSSLRGLLA